MKYSLLLLSLFLASCGCCNDVTVSEVTTDSTSVKYVSIDIPIPATDKVLTLFSLPIIHNRIESDTSWYDSLFTFQDNDTRGVIDLKNRTVSIHTDEKKVPVQVPEITHKRETVKTVEKEKGFFDGVTLKDILLSGFILIILAVVFGIYRTVKK